MAGWAVARWGFSWSGVGITTGENYPDALGATALQGLACNPLLYAPATNATGPAAVTVKAALAAHRFQIASVRYYGSAGALSLPVRDALEAALK